MPENKKYIVVLLVSMLNILPKAYAQEASNSPEKEYQVKAAFLYNFVKFVDWPKEKFSDVNDPIIIGIIGKDPFGNIFEALTDKKIKNKNVIVQRFKGFVELRRLNQQDKDAFNTLIQNIKKCHLLFICSSEASVEKDIITEFKNNSILTVGESQDFIKAGGIIGFMVEENKVRFDIDLNTCDKEKLKMSSQLLKLAKNVIKQK
jgi:hypothetical protein